MIKTFKHKGLRKLFEDADHRGVMVEHVRKLKQILSVLNEADRIEAITLPTFNLHQLKGEKRGTSAVTVRANWRVTFKFDADGAADVDYADYR
jgi:toxin HigB-1